MGRSTLKLIGVYEAWSRNVRQGRLTRANGGEVPVLVRVHDELAATPEVLARLREDARLLGRLQHESVLRLEHVSAVGGKVGEVYEGFECASAARILRVLRARNQVLPARAAVETAAAVGLAIDEALRIVDGDRAVVHLGPVPDEVLIDTAGRVKLAGFRVTRPGDPPVAAPKGYVAPEGVGSPAAATYLVGALLVELLSGEAPPEAAADPERHEAAVRRALIRVLARPGDTPGDPVVQAIRQAVAHDPAIRGGPGAFGRKLRELAVALQSPGLRSWAPGSIPSVQRFTPAPVEPPRASGGSMLPLPTDERTLIGGLGNNATIAPPDVPEDFLSPSKTPARDNAAPRSPASGRTIAPLMDEPEPTARMRAVPDDGPRAAAPRVPLPDAASRVFPREAGTIVPPPDVADRIAEANPPRSTGAPAPSGPRPGAPSPVPSRPPSGPVPGASGAGPTPAPAASMGAASRPAAPAAGPSAPAPGPALTQKTPSPAAPAPSPAPAPSAAPPKAQPAPGPSPAAAAPAAAPRPAAPLPAPASIVAGSPEVAPRAPAPGVVVAGGPKPPAPLPSPAPLPATSSIPDGVLRAPTGGRGAPNDVTRPAAPTPPAAASPAARGAPNEPTRPAAGPSLTAGPSVGASPRAAGPTAGPRVGGEPGRSPPILAPLGEADESEKTIVAESRAGVMAPLDPLALQAGPRSPDLRPTRSVLDEEPEPTGSSSRAGWLIPVFLGIVLLGLFVIGIGVAGWWFYGRVPEEELPTTTDAPATPAETPATPEAATPEPATPATPAPTPEPTPAPAVTPPAATPAPASPAPATPAPATPTRSPATPSHTTTTTHTAATPATPPPEDDAPVRIGARTPSTPAPATPAPATPAPAATPEAAPAEPAYFHVEFTAGDPSVSSIEVKCSSGTGVGSPTVAMDKVPKGNCRITGRGGDAPLITMVTVVADRSYTCFAGRSPSCR